MAPITHQIYPQPKIDNPKNENDKEVRTEFFEVILKIFRTPHFALKGYLFIFVLISSGLAAYTVIESFMSYFAYEVLSTSREVFETPTHYPQVTICNSNIFSTKYAFEKLKEVNAIVSPNISIFNASQMATLDVYNKLYLVEIIYLNLNGIVFGKSFGDENRKKLGHTLDDILIYCNFNQQNCTSADFVWQFDANFGNCFVFNSGFNSTGHRVPLKQSTVAGSLYGLQLKYYTNVYENLTPYYSYYGGNGASIRIENASYLIEHTYDSIKVAPGSHTEISIERAFKFTLPTPYSNCEVDESSPKVIASDLYNLIAQSRYQYNQQLCFTQCFQKQAIIECNCTASVFVSLLDANICQQPDAIACVLSLFNTKYLASSFISDVCVPLCPLECNSTRYRAGLSSNRFLGELFVDYVANNANLASDYVTKAINTDTVSNSIASVYIFYESLSYTLIVESPQMDIVSLLANIGGNLGLFLGLSLLSMCEIGEVLIEMLLKKKLNLKIKLLKQ